MTAGVEHARIRGFRLQRHVDALRSESKYFHAKSCDTAHIATGIQVGYAIHHVPGHESYENTTEVERVVMIMGCLHTKETWAPIIDMLMEQWHHHNGQPRKPLEILTFDNRGIGGSDIPVGKYSTHMMANDAFALMDYLDWHDAHVVGISMGGMIALETAFMAPTRIRSLSLLVTTRGRYLPDPSNSLLLFRSLFMADIPTMAKHMVHLLYPQEFLHATMIDLEDKSDASTTVMDVLYPFYRHFRETCQIPTPAGAFGQVSAVMTHWVSDARLDAIASHGFPILLIGAGRDNVIPSKETLALQQRLRGDHVQTVLFDDAGHNVYVQYVDEVSSYLMDTFARALQ